MFTFHEGPAHAKRLELRRAPDFLRVVIDADGTIDALDQLDDTPKTTETVHVYHRVGEPFGAFICGRSHKHSGYHVTAEYSYMAYVDGERLRDTGAWREWASSTEIPA